MRKLVLVGSFFFVSGSIALAGPVAVHWNCSPPTSAQSLAAGDPANHTFTIAQIKCTATKGELAGVKQQEGTGTEFHDVAGTADHFQGVFVETLASGDKVSYTYKGTAMLNAAGTGSANNTWMAASGTGKFKGIKANGTCKATANADKSVSFDCVGTYSLPK